MIDPIAGSLVSWSWCLLCYSLLALVRRKKEEDVKATETLIFPADAKASSEYNTGDVYVSLLKESGNTMIAHLYSNLTAVISGITIRMPSKPCWYLMEKDIIKRKEERNV